LGDLGVGEALGDEPQHLGLARRQLSEPLWAHGELWAEAGELVDQPAGDGGREERLAGGDDAHGLEQVLGGDVLEQKAAGARRERVVMPRLRRSIPWLPLSTVMLLAVAVAVAATAGRIIEAIVIAILLVPVLAFLVLWVIAWKRGQLGSGTH
jgi:hypothetical protein